MLTSPAPLRRYHVTDPESFADVEENPMNRSVTVVALTFVLLLIAAGTAGAQVTYQIDPAHTNVVFKVKHLDVAWVYGRFNDIRGTVTYDPARPEAGALDITIATDSVDTNQPKRDQHIKSPDFFNAKQFPVITFKSSAVARSGDGMTITGTLFLNGVSKQITVPFAITGQTDDGKGTKRIGGEAEFSLNRFDYNVKYMPDGLSAEVRVFVSIEAIKR